MVSLHKGIVVVIVSAGLVSTTYADTMSDGSSSMTTASSVSSVSSLTTGVMPTVTSTTIPVVTSTALPTVASMTAPALTTTASVPDSTTSDPTSADAATSDTSDVDVTTSEVKDGDYQVTGNLTIERNLYIYGNLTVTGNLTIKGGKLKVTGNLTEVGTLDNENGSLYVMGRRSITGNVQGRGLRLDPEYAAIDPYLLVDLSEDDLVQVRTLIVSSKKAETLADKTKAYDSLRAFIQDQDKDRFEALRAHVLAKFVPKAPAGLSAAKKAVVAAAVKTIATDRLQKILVRIDALVATTHNKKTVAILKDVKKIIDDEISSRETDLSQLLNDTGSGASDTAPADASADSANASTATAPAPNASIATPSTPTASSDATNTSAAAISTGSTANTIR